MDTKTKTGVVSAVYPDRGYGFVNTEEGQELFFHAAGVASPDFQDLKPGQVVEFVEVSYYDRRRRLSKKAVGVAAT